MAASLWIIFPWIILMINYLMSIFYYFFRSYYVLSQLFFSNIIWFIIVILLNTIIISTEFSWRELTKKLVGRAEAAGFKALVLTVDASAWGMRYADARNKFILPPHLKYVYLLNVFMNFIFKHMVLIGWHLELKVISNWISPYYFQQKKLNKMVYLFFLNFLFINL